MTKDTPESHFMELRISGERDKLCEWVMERFRHLIAEERIDDAISFFQARSLSDRASDLTLLKSNIDLGINTLEVASTGVESISGGVF